MRGGHFLTGHIAERGAEEDKRGDEKRVLMRKGKYVSGTCGLTVLFLERDSPLSNVNYCCFVKAAGMSQL